MKEIGASAEDVSPKTSVKRQEENWATWSPTFSKNPDAFDSISNPADSNLTLSDIGSKNIAINEKV